MFREINQRLNIVDISVTVWDERGRFWRCVSALTE